MSEQGGYRYLSADMVARLKKMTFTARSVVEGTKSGLIAKPDIAITGIPKQFDWRTIITIIECKCQKKVDAKLLRHEYGDRGDFPQNFASQDLAFDGQAAPLIVVQGGCVSGRACLSNMGSTWICVPGNPMTAC